MLYTEQIRKAVNIAYKAHDRQLDKAGMPYILHPLYVCECLDTEEEMITALLHDVIEDAPQYRSEIEQTFSKEVTEAVLLLTRSKNQDYFEYIEAIKSNKLAARVKLADLKHNMILDRLPVITAKDEKRIEKYKKAALILEKAMTGDMLSNNEVKE